MRWLSTSVTFRPMTSLAQARAVGQRQRGVVLQVRDRREQPCDFILAEHHGQGLRHTHGLDLCQQLAAAQRHLEEELQCGERGVDRDRRGTLVDHVQLKAAQILSGCSVGRSLEKDGQATNCANVAGLGSRLQLAHAHVVEHALTQRGDGRSPEFHGCAPVEERGGLPRSSTVARRLSEHSTASQRSVAARAA